MAGAETNTSKETEVKTNKFWLGYLTANCRITKTWTKWISNGGFRRTSIPADLKAMAAKYLDGDNYIRLVLLPDTTLAKTTK